jgi:glucosamine--fructose-6-phosphate aminotransferase (isomerizing)
LFSLGNGQEVLVNLIDYFYNQEEVDNAELAVRLALSKVVGAYGSLYFVVMKSTESAGPDG